jgi:GNAT superfamily N-acetyltransferase
LLRSVASDRVYLLAMPDTRPGPQVIALKTFTRIRTRGPKEVVSLVAARAREAVSSDDVLKLYQRSTTERRPTGDRPDLLFREADASHGPLYARDIGTDSPETFRRRLSERTRCFLVLRADLVVHSTWVTTAGAWTRELGRYLCPPPAEAYVYESFTRPEVRGQGVYPFALERIIVWLATRELRRAWVGVEAGNDSSIRAVTKAGFSEGFEIAYHRRAGRVRLQPPTGPLADIGESFVAKRCESHQSGE